MVAGPSFVGKEWGFDAIISVFTEAMCAVGRTR